MAISFNDTIKPLQPLSNENASLQQTEHKTNVFDLRFFSAVKSSEVQFFISQLSLMLSIETPLNEALQTIEAQAENEALKEVIQQMLRDIEEGHQLSEAMKRHPHVFDGILTSMVKAGETGGFLKNILKKIMEIRENQNEIMSMIKSKLTYPAILFLMTIIVVIYVLAFVLPKFALFFAGKEQFLPFSTRFLLGVSYSLQHYWWIYLASVLALLISFRILLSSNTGKQLKDWVIVNAPVIARLSNKVYMCRLLRTMGYLMDSDVPILDALIVTKGTIDNRYFQQLIGRIADNVSEGGKFSQPFASNPYTLPTVKQMVATGEESGNLPSVMLQLADHYDNEVEQELKFVTSLIEPLALIFMGAAIGIIVSSVILPMFKLVNLVN